MTTFRRWWFAPTICGAATGPRRIRRSRPDISRDSRLWRPEILAKVRKNWLEADCWVHSSMHGHRRRSAACPAGQLVRQAVRTCQVFSDRRRSDSCGLYRRPRDCVHGARRADSHGQPRPRSNGSDRLHAGLRGLRHLLPLHAGAAFKGGRRTIRGAIAGRRVSAQAAARPDRTAHAYQYACQPALADRRRFATREGNGRPVDRLSARRSFGVAYRNHDLAH